MKSKAAPLTAKVNAKGVLEIGGCGVIRLAKDFGTPLYIVDKETLITACRDYAEALEKAYPRGVTIYASKALCLTRVLKLIKQEGLGADVVSGGELYAALKAGINPAKIFFNGNNKSPRELEEALNKKVGHIVVDNLEELKKLNQLAREKKTIANILFRVNPGIEAHTHEFIQTGKVNSKFGIAKEQIIGVIKLAQEMKGIDFVGIHAHLGSQITSLDSFLAEVDLLINLAVKIKTTAGKTCRGISLGGGLGIAYLENDPLLDIKVAVTAIGNYFAKKVKEAGLGEPFLVLEPGRSIVGRAGVTLYTVGVVKKIPGIEKYVVVDGGMGDNPRPILYGAQYQALIANKANQKAKDLVTIAGRYCESGDIITKGAKLQSAVPGDLLAVFATGAYNYSMASNYNQVGKPAMVIVGKGEARLIVKRQTYKDLLKNEV